jgi:hypothetical protein
MNELLRAGFRILTSRRIVRPWGADAVVLQQSPGISPVRAVIVLIVFLSLVLPTGCSRGSLRPTMPWAADNDQPTTPASVVAVWTNAVLEQASGPPTRGFGGRLMFYGNDDKPVRVDGTLMVYAFQECGQGPRETPDRKYAFTRQQLGEHYSQSKLGHSYSIWIPWDPIGGPQQQVSLIVRFSPVEGPAIVGSQTKLTLPGPEPPATEIAARERAGSDESSAAPETASEQVRPAAHYTPIPPRRIGSNGETGRRRQMVTTTIPLPAAGR